MALDVAERKLNLIWFMRHLVVSRPMLIPMESASGSCGAYSSGAGQTDHSTKKLPYGSRLRFTTSKGAEVRARLMPRAG